MASSAAGVIGPGEGRGRVTIVGAGIVGACSAAWLQRKGFQVTIVDRSEPGQGASFGNAGSLSPNAGLPIAMPGMLRQVPGWLLDPLGPLSIRPAYLPRLLPWLFRFMRFANPADMRRCAEALSELLRPLFDCLDPLVQHAGATDLVRKNGALYVYDSEEARDADRRIMDLRRSLGARLVEIGEGDVRQLEPALSRAFRWAVFAPDNGATVNPERLTRVLVEQAQADGATFLRRDVRGVSVAPDGTKVLHTEAGEVRADTLVIAAGAWSHRLARDLGDRIPLETQRGYHVTLTDPGIEVRRVVAWPGRRVFSAPMEMGLRVAGTVELAGLDAEPNWQRADALVRAAADMYPDIRTAEERRWMGHRPCLPDSLPVVGPAPSAPGVLYAFGHQHIGMCSAPATGRSIAELVAGEPVGVDLSPFRADRF